MIWEGRYVFAASSAAFRGRAADNSPHRHATAQVVIAHGTLATITRPGMPGRTAAALLVKPGVVHALAPVEHVTLIFLEPQTATGAKLLREAGPADVTELPDDFARSFAPDLPLAESLARLERAHADALPDEPRLRLALRALAEDDAPAAISRAATVAGVSASRLRALAQAHLGTPLTAWLMWRRLERAGKALAQGATLAEAACDAGFADQAHLSRTTRKIFGVTPSTAGGVLKNGQAKGSRPA